MTEKESKDLESACKADSKAARNQWSQAAQVARQAVPIDPRFHLPDEPGACSPHPDEILEPQPAPDNKSEK